MTRHFLTVDDLDAAELLALLDHADALKAERAQGGRQRDDLAGRTVGLLFEKPSTRTRVSFEVGVAELGGHPLVLSSAELQLGRGETVGDTARVLSRYLDALAVRTFAQSRLETLAAEGTIPIINMLSDLAHPCQALADLQTIREATGGLAGRRLTYLGDGNNVAHSLLVAGALVGLDVTVAHPEGYGPDREVLARARAHAATSGAEVTATTDHLGAVAGADVLYTDVWASMGQEGEADARAAAFAPYRLDGDALAAAAEGAIVLHCLPAHRGEEISASALDGPQSRVWDQAENRLHAQKALLLALLG